MNQTPELLFTNNIIDKPSKKDLVEELNEYIYKHSDICTELTESLENKE